MRRPSALKLGREHLGLAVAAQALDDGARLGVEQGEVAVVAADGEQPPARHEGEAADLPARHPAEAAERAQGARVGEHDRAVAAPGGEQPAVRADGVADEHVEERVAMRVRHDAEHAAQPPVAGEVPDDDLAVEAAGVERAGRRG